MKKFVVGNWKMHGEPAMAQALAQEVARFCKSLPRSVEVVISPPAPLISMVSAAVERTGVQVGAQDCHAQQEGAFTGDASASMLKAVGASYVIVGHSERRQHHHESNETVRQKATAAIAAGLKPIICIGETLEHRQSGKAESVVEKQVRESLPETVASGNFLLAYEPVWAIGSGQTPSVDDIRKMHLHIKDVAAGATGLRGDQINVLYGGSVKASNAREIMATDGVAGVLVGGASLKAEEFSKIMASA
jgi:triosephosphate isomerase